MLPHCLPPLRLSSHPSTHPPSGKTVVAIYIKLNYKNLKINKTYRLSENVIKLTGTVRNGRSGLPFTIPSAQIDG
jgi:hypothetical protein